MHTWEHVGVSPEAKEWGYGGLCHLMMGAWGLCHLMMGAWGLCHLMHGGMGVVSLDDEVWGVVSLDAWGHGGVVSLDDGGMGVCHLMNGGMGACPQRLRNGLSVYNCFVFVFVFVFLPWQEEDKFGLLQRSGQQIFIKICCVPDSGNGKRIHSLLE